MKNFTYYRPRSAPEAVRLLDARWGTSELLAGGTDLLSLQKEYVAQPSKVVSLGALPADFRQVTTLEREPPGFVLGAGVTLAQLAASADVRKHLPALAKAADDIAGPQVRNMGTLGGNLCQRNRCWYFRDEHVNCLLKGGDKCFALDGENRFHAIFTRGHKCVIVQPSTLATVLIALGASAEVLGPAGKRTVELAKFFRAPSGAGEREHVLAANEMVLSVRVSALANGRNAHYEVRQKLSSDWPLVQAAVAFQLEGGKAKGVKVVLGHVAPTPHVAAAAAAAVEGKEVTEELAGAAGEKAAEGAKPLAQNGYKVKLVAIAVKRALLIAAGARKYWEA
jgi:xanthine dehydrogenase YagS FAD-binding subunit